MNYLTLCNALDAAVWGRPDGRGLQKMSMGADARPKLVLTRRDKGAGLEQLEGDEMTPTVCLRPEVSNEGTTETRPYEVMHRGVDGAEA